MIDPKDKKPELDFEKEYGQRIEWFIELNKEQ